MTTPCPSGTVADATSPLICHKSCTANVGDECPPSQQCVPNPSVLYCEVGVCRDDSDCVLGLAKCDPASGKCVSTTAPPDMAGQTGAVGDPCTSGAQCASGGCLAPSTTWPMGYCSLLCTYLDDFTDTCPSGSYCSAGFAGVEGVCLDLCDTGATVTRFGSCRTGYTCKPLGDNRFGVCLM